ncbi:hypothetical protein [Streptomyces sp. NPDC089795]|uniref:hypothetical protein n=1 Tax=Streptomyces sp. NPDC089795 TaxID=3155297 RepID=UPI0034218507
MVPAAPAGRQGSDRVCSTGSGSASEITGEAADAIGPQIGPGITADWPDTMAALAESALR